MQVITIRNWLLSDASLHTLRKLVTVLLLLGCSYLLAILTWQLFSATPDVRPVTPRLHNTMSVADNRPGSQRLTIINNAALFGTAAKPESTAQTSAPRSRLNAQLTGIMASSVPSRSIAIIARNGQQQSYVTGDVIQGTDARITSILPDRVIISRQAQEHALVLDDDATTATPTANAPANNAIAGVRQQILKNPGRLMDYINISPVRENNQLKGYRLNPGRNPAFFAQSGLQPDDLAISINGLDLRNNADAAQAMQQLTRQTEMNVTVERNGVEQDIYINLEQP